MAVCQQISQFLQIYCFDIVTPHPGKKSSRNSWKHWQQQTDPATEGLAEAHTQHDIHCSPWSHFFLFFLPFLSMNVYNHNFLILVDAFLYMVRVLFIAFFWGGTYIAHYPDCMSFLGLTHKGQGNTFFLSVLLCCLPVVIISSPELKAYLSRKLEWTYLSFKLKWAYLISTCRSSISVSPSVNI